MNWVLIIMVAIQLTNLAHLGLIANAVTDLKTAEFQEVTVWFQNEPSSLRQIPYTINTDEVQGAAEILANIGSVYVDSATTVPVIDSITSYTVLDAQGEPVAQDVFIPGLKETVTFNATNTVLAAAFLDFRLGSWPIPEQLELYGRFDDDPNFPVIVQRVRDSKGLRSSDKEVFNRIKQLTQDVAVKYLQEKGLLPDLKDDGF
jgi:hypothetical protein